MTEQNQTSHYDIYPEGEVSPLLAYAFRPFFILLPAYIALSIILWGLVWSGQINLFIDNVLVWHIYEMMFGVASAGIIGFILTGVPEFYNGVKPIIGKTLLSLVTLWIIGRVAFWMIDWLGVIFVALTNLPLLIWVTALIAKPIFLDPLRRNVSLALTFIGIIVIQGWFFASMSGWAETDFMRILKLALGAFMVLELLALRRINTGAINEWLEDRNIDDTFIARPPRYNIAILSVMLFTIFEFFIPNNPILGWLGLASAAAILNTLNDFFMDEASIVFKSYILPLFLILVLMATGYGLMGFDYLNNDLYGINHFRHFLTTGVFGLSFFMVMVIVGTIHTGRVLAPNRWIDFSVALIIIATILRSLIPFVPEYTHWLYLGSSIIWAIPFIIYLVLFYPFLSQPRIDGLPG
jgi:uncharacterized protein involved in response to NO